MAVQGSEWQNRKMMSLCVKETDADYLWIDTNLGGYTFQFWRANGRYNKCLLGQCGSIYPKLL